MVSATALQLRQSLGRILGKLKRTGEPILLTKGNRPVAVIISLTDFEERFAAQDAAESRRRLVAQIDELARPSIEHVEATQAIRELRDGR